MLPRSLTLLCASLLCACPVPPASDDGETGSETSASPGDGDGDGDGDGEGDGDGDGDDSLVGPICAPRDGDCGPGVVCCSTDAAALDFMDLSANVQPRDDGAVMLFADTNNDLSFRGVCVNEGGVPEHAQLPNAPGCPWPCNPLWSASDINAVCGNGYVCCQVVEIEESDCVFDVNEGNAGCWRPATGGDIGVLSMWGVDEHATHQDPGLAGDGACEMLIAGIPPEHDPEQVRAACHARLGVASQRGMCIPASGIVCPYAEPTYRNACETKNDDMGLSGCG